MGRPKTISDDELLKIARECFLEGGPHVPTRVIAEKAGLSQPALFRRFKTKDELFMAAIATKDAVQLVARNLVWLSKNPTRDPIEPQLEELLTRVWKILLEMIPRIIALHTHRSADNTFPPHRLAAAFKKPPPIRILDGVTQFVERAQNQGQFKKDLDARAMAMNIMGTVQGLAMFQQFLGLKMKKGSDAAYIRQTSRTLCNGFSIDGAQK